MESSERNLLNEISTYVDENADEMTSKLRGLISIPTENPPGNNYAEMAKLLSNDLSKLDYETQLIKVPDDLQTKFAPHGEGLPRVNVIAKLRGHTKKPVIHLNGHFDVVPAGGGWSCDPFAGTVSNGKIYGRGSTDMKSGIVAQIFAVEALRHATQELGLHIEGSIEHSFTCDEETGGFAGLGYLIDEGYIDPPHLNHICITEPTDAKYIIVGHRGVLWFQIRTHGKKAHAGKAKLGVNAIDHMATLINKITTELRPKIETKRDSEVIPGEGCIPTITPTIINAGLSMNIVPDVCLAKFDRRLSTKENTKDALTEIEKVLQAASREEPQLRYDLERLMTQEPVKFPRDTRIATAIGSSIAEVMGVKPEFGILAATCDLKFLAKAGMNECLAYGPGLVHNSHVTDEYVTAQNLKNATKVTAYSLGKLLLKW